MRYSIAFVAGIAASVTAIPTEPARNVDTVANELACVARGDMACAGLVSKRSENELANELACVARGDMACAGVRTPVVGTLCLADICSWSPSVTPRWSSSPTSWLALPGVTWPAPVYVYFPLMVPLVTFFNYSYSSVWKLVSKKRAVERAINELACTASGDMACAGVSPHLPRTNCAS
ncbi:hypothetical protein CBS470a_011103 [Colletotrichum nupharicola]|nr:hypothetical protein CBS470a_011103 [Colletotrichum nupharicola]